MSVKTKFIKLIDEIVRKETDKDGIDDIYDFSKVVLNNDPYMDLIIQKDNHKDIYTVGHFIDNDLQQPDPAIQFDLSDDEVSINWMIQSTSIVGGKSEENEEKIEDFIQMIWYNNLKNQFDLYGQKIE